MTTPINLDLISVGITVAGIGIIGFTVFFNNRRSSTNRIFLAFAIATIFWSVSNYLIYQFTSPDLILLITRLHMFFSVWYSFYIFQLFRIFPSETAEYSKKYKTLLLPGVIFTAVLTLTPLVLSNVAEISGEGGVAVIKPGSGILLFGITVIGLIGSGIVFLWRKMRKVVDVEKAQFTFILAGAAITFSLHLAFNFLLPIIFSNPRFVPFGAVFPFPFIALTAYAIFRHHLLNIKVIATEILAFILAIVSLFEIVISKDPYVLVFRSGIFALVLGFGILLIRSVLREVEQREELQRLTEELKAANTKLEDLSRFKTQLLSLASHQVKAPLAVIKQFASILIEGLYGPISDKVKETLGKMRSSADELINLINNLLDLRKVEEGKMDYQFAKVDFLKLVKDLVEELRPLAMNKKLELSFETDLKEAFVSADAQKLAQVIQNLIDNAIKYTPEGFVKVKLEEVRSVGSGQANGEFVVSVTDSGLGLPAELIPHLFEEFQRDERVKKEIRGTGLGLFIARKIVEAHSGKLWAESDGEGKGSAFYIQLKKI